jgi:hypothetical protein
MLPFSVQLFYLLLLLLGSLKETNSLVPPNTPIPFLALSTAIIHLLTLGTPLHTGCRYSIAHDGVLCIHEAVGTTDIFLYHSAGVTHQWLSGLGIAPSQIRLGLTLTRCRLISRCITAEFWMQTQDHVAVFLTGRTAVMKIPTAFTPVRMGRFGRFHVRTGRGGAFGKVSPPLWCLVFGIPHEADGKEFALH